MSKLAKAVDFLQFVRETPELNALLLELAIQPDSIDGVIRLAHQHSYPIERQDLIAALGWDWNLRWVRYGEKIIAQSHTDNHSETGETLNDV